ncbi:hypothetical protein HQ533_03840 [Candidatus Woesearchaeota archaeon]|nr:hypothetical protein [Candidatus Woesearchaeota archaeon]
MAKEGSNYVALAGVLGGILLVVLVLFVILAKEMMVTALPTVVWGYVVLGIVLAFFQFKSDKK